MRGLLEVQFVLEYQPVLTMTKPLLRLKCSLVRVIVLYLDFELISYSVRLSLTHNCVDEVLVCLLMSGGRLKQ